MERDFAALLEQCRRGGVEVRADSRQVGPGDVFVAVPGASEDGARFISAAVAAGAAESTCPLHPASTAAKRNPSATNQIRFMSGTSL